MPPEASICVVDDDAAVLDSLALLLESEGFVVHAYRDAAALLDHPVDEVGCVISDVRMPGIDGLELLQALQRQGAGAPVIMITGHADIPLAVRAMQLGAVDFIEKPFAPERLFTGIRRALVGGARERARRERPELRERLERLTGREREVFELLTAGRSNKQIARDLAISPRTVEIHRARVMEKMASGSLAELVRDAIALGIEAPER